MRRSGNVFTRGASMAWLRGSSWLARVALVLSAALCTAGAARAADPVVIPVILPLSGGAAFLGQGERDALQLQAKVINAAGGIGGAPVQFDVHDDQSSPQVAVQLAAQVATRSPPIVLGSALVAMCNAIAPVLKNGPVLYCLSPGIHPAAGSRVFTSFISTHDLAAALIRYYRGHGFTRLAMIVSSDASGQDGKQGFEDILKLPENAGVSLVASEQFNPTDVSVTAQVEKMRDAEPQAVIVWTSGAPMGTVLKAIVQVGLDVPVATTDANMTYAQMKQYAAFLPKEMLFLSSEWPPHGPSLTLDPAVVAAQEKMFGAYQAAGVQPDIAAALAWDPGLLAIAALQSQGRNATPEQVRTYLAGVTRWGGINGVYDFQAVPQRGLNEDDGVVTRWQPDKGNWVIVSKPGGAPL
jgi:branched-chain amino acid transport system substrate-binding protein